MECERCADHFCIKCLKMSDNGYEFMCERPGATFSKLLRKILGKDSYLIDDLGKTAILKTS